MSTHIPADYFSKPILADLGVGKRPGCNGWIRLDGNGILVRETAGGGWAPSTAWQDDKHGIDSGSRSRAICGVIAPTGDRWDNVEGPAETGAGQFMARGLPEGPPGLYGRALVNWSSDGKHPHLSTFVLGEKTIGHLWHEGVDAWRARAKDLFAKVTGMEAFLFNAGGLVPFAPAADRAAVAKWHAWAEEHEAELRQRWALRLPRRVYPCTCRGDFSDGMITHAGDCKADSAEPDFAAIDCAGCLAAWDVFSAHTGATVEVIPREYLPDAEDDEWNDPDRGPARL